MSCLFFFFAGLTCRLGSDEDENEQEECEEKQQQQNIDATAQIESNITHQQSRSPSLHTSCASMVHAPLYSVDTFRPFFPLICCNVRVTGICPLVPGYCVSVRPWPRYDLVSRVLSLRRRPRYALV